MQLYPIILIAVIIAADGGALLKWDGAGVGPGVAAAVACGGVLAVLLAATVATRRCARRMETGRGPRAIVTAERIARGSRVLILINHAVAVLALGWLDAVRGVVGNPVLVDEVIAIAPALAGLLGTWWVFYPIERRMREAMLVRRLDQGAPIHEIPSRWGYVLLQARLQVLLLLVPVLLIAASGELIRKEGAEFLPANAPAWLSQAMVLAAALVIFLFSPLLARVVLDVQPLAAGTLRDELISICARHRVRVRRILMWNTSGMMINAAVMGLIGRLRYVLLTDALVESMTRSQVHAVMAHEIAHVRRHHMPWLAVALLGVLSVTEVAVETPLRLLEFLFRLNDGLITRAIEISAVALELAVALVAFGWISRRFERQADTFAVQHLSMAAAASGPVRSAGDALPQAAASAGEPVISAEAVESMRDALGTIARLNAVPPYRPSWRHGSIAWRRAYLQTLIGRPAGKLAIDRQIRWIKALVAAALIGSLAVSWGLSLLPGPDHQDDPMIRDAGS
jgi:STE24 endopeptidase